MLTADECRAKAEDHLATAADGYYAGMSGVHATIGLGYATLALSAPSATVGVQDEGRPA